MIMSVLEESRATVDFKGTFISVKNMDFKRMALE